MSMSLYASVADYKAANPINQSTFPDDSSHPPYAHTIIKEGSFPRTSFIAVFFYQDEETGRSWKRTFDGIKWTLIDGVIWNNH